MDASSLVSLPEAWKEELAHEWRPWSELFALFVQTRDDYDKVDRIFVIDRLAKLEVIEVTLKSDAGEFDQYRLRDGVTLESARALLQLTASAETRNP